MSSNILTKLCSPSLLFLVVSIVILLISFFQNISFRSSLSLGKVKNEIHMTAFVYVLVGVAIIFWTFLIDKMCKLGYSKVSWGLFVVPTCVILGILALFVFMQGFSMSMKLNNDAFEFQVNVDQKS